MASNVSVLPSLYDDHTKRHSTVTHAQLTFFIAWLFAVLALLVRIPRSLWAFQSSKQDEQDVEKSHLTTECFNESSQGPNSVAKDALELVKTEPNQSDVTDTSKIRKSGPEPVPTPTVNQALFDAVVFGAIMMYFFLCDYMKIWPEEPRIYNRDLFLFLIFLLFLTASVFTLRTTHDKILNRDQTEEWKGWMQVMFVWYHYFAAAEWYNMIRIYISCYVWMTGFGNFSFFWVRKDYSLWRVLKMLFRMNFLVIAVCIATSNEYMLYYICAMHTYWFFTVYVFMRILRSWNTHRWKMAVKFAAYVVCNALVFEIPGNCAKLFRPLWFVFQFHYEKVDVMHEWEFRAGLDHWACLLGMLCAYNYPHFESFIKYLESPSQTKTEAKTKKCLKLAMVALAVGVGVTWYTLFMRKGKFEYNKTHCYTSMLPILVFVVLRNSFAILRRHHLALFGALGKITLETYLSQIHVYLQSNAKHLLGYILGYPLLNFALATIIYLFISQTLFTLTLNFSAFLIRKEWKEGAKTAGVVGLVFLVSLGLSVVYKIAT